MSHALPPNQPQQFCPLLVARYTTAKHKLAARAALSVYLSTHLRGASAPRRPACTHLTTFSAPNYEGDGSDDLA